MRVLGLDPGYGRLGVAILEGNRQQQTLLFSGCFETDQHDTFEVRLHEVVQYVRQLVHTHAPECIALETLFFSKNQKTAMHVAETRGALLVVAGDTGLPVRQFAPQEVKVAVAGNGRGSKDDVASMLNRLLTIPKKKMLDDEYDAIAVALTCLVSWP